MWVMDWNRTSRTPIALRLNCSPDVVATMTALLARPESSPRS
jgi:hypothetical protein